MISIVTAGIVQTMSANYELKKKKRELVLTIKGWKDGGGGERIIRIEFPVR